MEAVIERPVQVSEFVREAIARMHSSPRASTPEQRAILREFELNSGQIQFGNPSGEPIDDE